MPRGLNTQENVLQYYKQDAKLIRFQLKVHLKIDMNVGFKILHMFNNLPRRHLR